MQVTIDIPDELAAQARARGLALEAYLLELIASETAKPNLIPLGKGPYSPQEAVDRIREERKNNRLDGLKIKDLINEGRRF
jgi:tricorn protease-like protein